jgi:chromosome segregation ATPase
MESFELLEKKIAQLASLVAQLKEENKNLAKDNATLQKKLSALERDVVEGNESIEHLTTEKEATKGLISDLIKSIDKLVEGGAQL